MKSNKKNFDAIIIGSGIGGLVTASQLAAKGAQVLVLEKYIIPGGSGGSFKRNGYTFDVGASMMFGFGDKNKVHKVTIANTGETFEVTGKINLLQAALNAGIEWPCECRVGSCGTCRVILKEGKVKELADFAYTLDGDMLKEGYILACQSSLKSDLVVELDKEQKPL